MRKEEPMFPHDADYVRNDKGPGYVFKEEFHPGASQRLWLAGMAMQGMLASYRLDSEIAKQSVELADALLKELCNDDTSDIS